MITRFHTNDVDRLEKIFNEFWSPRSSYIPPMDLWEQDGVLTVRASIPGVNPQDIQITLEDSVLTLSGESHKNEELKEAKVYRMETAHGSFTRSVRLNGRYDSDKIEASFENGVVTVKIPRNTADQKRVIDIKLPSTPESPENN